jgi:hypothetical protein
MYLKKPLWSEGIENEKQDSTGSSSSSSSSDPNGSVLELVNSLQQQRVYREVTLALTTGLRDARAEFSFLRLRALRSILNFLNSIAHSDSTIYLFNLTQSIPQLQGSSLFLLHSFYFFILFLFYFNFYYSDVGV